jgi:hypothetical protein
MRQRGFTRFAVAVDRIAMATGLRRVRISVDVGSNRQRWQSKEKS